MKTLARRLRSVAETPPLGDRATKSEFLDHALRDDIEDVVSRHFRSATGGMSACPVPAWKQSLLEVDKVLQDEEIPPSPGVGIEYQLPQTSKRINFSSLRVKMLGLA